MALQQTKNLFRVVGKVVRIDTDYAWKEGEQEKGERQGQSYRSLRFGVKTSEENEITVEMYDYEPTEVFLWSNEKKDEDPNYKGDRVDYDEWIERQDELREEGLAVLASRVGLFYDKDGKLESKGVPKYVASKMIYDEIDNGDWVAVEGEIRYSRFEKNGKLVEKKQYSIEKLHRTTEKDFNAENYEEISYFEQQFVYIDTEIDKKEGKAIVTGRTINYRKQFHDTQFIIDFRNLDGEGYDKDMVTLADSFKKKMKFGDLLRVHGQTWNKVLIEEVNDEEADKEKNKLDVLASLGGKSKPKHAQKWTNKTFITEMQIEGVDEWDKKYYTEEDFKVDELIQKDDDLAGLGGKKNKQKDPFSDPDNDPFSNDGQPIDISDDDLPF